MLDSRGRQDYPAAMHLLAIDTSADLCSVGVAVDGQAPVVRSMAVGRAHAERLMPMVESAMNAAEVAFADLTRIAVTVGPGSFTGIRIGVAAARGLALATGAKAIAIGTLAVHAEAARALLVKADAMPVPIVAAVAAGRGELYAQRFSLDGTAQGEPQLASPDAIRVLIDAATALAGSGADALAAVGLGNPIVHRESSPDIAALLRLARQAPEQGEAPRPLYLRPPDAKPQMDAQVRRQ
jgi:tRNA threonylcarbamoyladenosine biosynthesis protein TsaB